MHEQENNWPTFVRIVKVQCIQADHCNFVWYDFDGIIGPSLEDLAIGEWYK
jgi:hypothetical protein